MNADVTVNPLAENPGPATCAIKALASTKANPLAVATALIFAL